MSDEENGFDNGADIKAGLIIHHESILHLAFLDATIRHCVFDALIEWMVDGIYSPPDNRRAALVFELIARKNAMQIAKYRETLEKKSDAGRISGESRRKRAELNRCSTGVEQELNRCSTGVEQVLNYKKGNNKGNKKEKEKENISRPVAVRARACVNGDGNGNGLLIPGGKGSVVALARRFADAVKADRDNGGSAFFDPAHDPAAMMVALTGDAKSVRRWRQLAAGIPDADLRQELFTAYREISCGEEPHNRAAALNARLGKMLEAYTHNGEKDPEAEVA